MDDIKNVIKTNVSRVEDLVTTMNIYQEIHNCQTYEELGLILETFELNEDERTYALHKLCELAVGRDDDIPHQHGYGNNDGHSDDGGDPGMELEMRRTSHRGKGFAWRDLKIVTIL